MRRAAAVAALGLGLVATEIALRTETELRAQVIGPRVAFAIFLPAAWLSWRGLGAGRAGLLLVLAVSAAANLAAFDPSGPPPLTLRIVPAPDSSCQPPANAGLYSHREWSVSTP